MKAGGFDFNQSCSLDFNVDFNSWLPPGAARRTLEQKRHCEMLVLSKLRVWIAERELHCSMKVGMYRETMDVAEVEVKS